MAKDADEALKYLKDEDIQFVDLRFTDPRGKMQHLTRTSPRSTRICSPGAVS